MTNEEIIERLKDIEGLVREHRYELALALTAKLEEAIASLPPGEAAVSRPVLDLVQASRLLTETLIRLQDLRIH